MWIGTAVALLLIEQYCVIPNLSDSRDAAKNTYNSILNSLRKIYSHFGLSWRFAFPLKGAH